MPVTFLKEEKTNEEEQLRNLSLKQPDDFLKEYLEDEREDLYQDYAQKIKKMKTGDVVVVHYPFSNLVQTKVINIKMLFFVSLVL